MLIAPIPFKVTAHTIDSHQHTHIHVCMYIYIYVYIYILYTYIQVAPVANIPSMLPHIPSIFINAEPVMPDGMRWDVFVHGACDDAIHSLHRQVCCGVLQCVAVCCSVLQGVCEYVIKVQEPDEYPFTPDDCCDNT